MSILKYLFRLLLLLFLVYNQEAEAQQDTIFRPSVIAGMDVSGFAREYFDPGTRQWEWSLSAEVKEDVFVSAEAGFLNTSINKETHNYFADGWFIRAGVDYNLLERNEKNISDLLLLIFRYGYGNLSHESTRIIIPDDYWGDYQTSLPREPWHAHWLELGAGIKARVIGEFYLGWSLRTRVLLYGTEDSVMDPYFIGGYGKGDRNPNVMIQYSLFYHFAL